jgi:hypothetical protein
MYMIGVNSKRVFLIFYLTLLYFVESWSQGVCYQYIQRKYIRYQESAATTVLSSMNNQAISNNGKYIYTVGNGTVRNANHTDNWLMQYNDTGKFIRAIKFGKTGANNNETTNDVQTLSSGAVMVCGSTRESTLGTTNLGFISFFDATGKLRWTRRTPSSNRNNESDEYNTIYKQNDNSFLVVGNGSQKTGKQCVIATLIDSSGNTSWTSHIDLNNNSHDAFGAVRIGNEWAVTGWAQSTQTYPFVIFLNNAGMVNRAYKGNSNGQNTFGRSVLSSHGIIYTIGTSGTGFTAQTLVTAFDKNGNRRWSRSIGANNNQEGGQNIVLEGSSLWITSRSQPFGSNRTLIYQLDTATGTTITNPKILSNGNTNFTNNDYARTFEPLAKGGISVIGLDNAAGIHGNFMINSPCQTNCGTATATLNNAAANWTWTNSTSTFVDLGNLTSVTFDTLSFGINVTINCKQDCPMPVKATTSPLLICPGNTFVNIAAGQPLGESYLWSDGNNNSARSFFNDGTYYLTTSNPCGSRQDTVVVVKTGAPVKPSNLKDTTFCTTNFSYGLDVSQIGSKYVWDNGSTLPTRLFTKAGVYWLDTRNACGSRVDSVRFKVIPPPVSPMLLDTNICFAQSITLNFPKVSTSKYEWSDFDTMVPKDIFQSGTVTLRVYNACGEVFDTVQIVTKYAPFATMAKDTTFCSSNFLWDVNWSQWDADFYVWENFTTTPQRQFNYSGKFWLTAGNRCGITTDTFNIYVDTLPVKRLVTDVYFCSGETYVINGEQYNSPRTKYRWSNGLKIPNIGVAQSGTYTLETSNACGVRMDTVRAYAVRCDCKMWIPDAFTPLGSPGVNQEVLPMFVDDWGNTCGVKEGTWSIYNRWGECVFKDQPLSVAWNGMYNNNILPTGIYVYLIKATFDSSVTGFRNFNAKGTILLLDAKD